MTRPWIPPRTAPAPSSMPGKGKRRSRRSEIRPCGPVRRGAWTKSCLPPPLDWSQALSGAGLSPCRTETPAQNRRRGGIMQNTLTIGAVAAALIALTTMSAGAETAPIKIGVLGDQSSAYSDLGGKGSVVAAQMAVEDFGGKL